MLRVVHHPWLTLGTSALLLLACGLLGWFHLPISTDQNKLFSSNVAFFHDFLKFNEKFPENEAVYVVIEPVDPHHPPPVERWTAAADAIAARVRPLPEVVSVDAHVPLDQLGTQGVLFDDPPRVHEHFREIVQFGTLLRVLGSEDLTTRLLGSTRIARFLRLLALAPDPRVASFVAALADSWQRTIAQPDLPLRPGEGLPDLNRLGTETPRDLGYYYEPDDSDPTKHLLLVRVYPKSNTTSLTGVTKVVDAIRGATDDAAKAFPDFTVGVTGRPALDGDEMRTTDHDSNLAEAFALSAVFLGLVVMLRSFWLALAAEICLGVGIGWTFGWATISVGELNLLSIVFLIALIGIGMDYLVQVLTRYREESRRRSSPRTIWIAVFRYVGPPINTACLGAAGAFLVSVLTPFKGAADLGVIAGGGLLLCLLSGYTVLPALLTIFPLRRNGTIAPSEPNPRARIAAPPHTKVPACPSNEGRPRLKRLLPPLAWALLLLLGMPFAQRANFNPNLLELQAPKLPSVKLVRKLQTWSAVVLSKDLGQLRQVRQALDRAPTVASTESILTAYDNAQWLREHANEVPEVAWSEPGLVKPSDLPAIASRARTLADRFEAQAHVTSTAPTSAPSDAADAHAAAQALRGVAQQMTDAQRDPRRAAAVAARLSAWQGAFVAQLKEMLAPFQPQQVQIDKLPPELRSHLVAADGTYALYIYPREDLWKRPELTRFVRDIEQRVAGVPGAPAPTGIAIDIYHSTRSIEGAFYKATAYAFILIVLLVFLDLRRLSETLMAVSVLALGLPMLVALMGLFGISWNFANFFALPILIGAGHEYGVFMVHRYREARADPRRAWRGIDVSDRALLLCAYVTSTSFGFFWFLGHHRGLKSLGLVMAMGTACIYLATIMVLRPLLKLKLETSEVQDRA